MPKYIIIGLGVVLIVSFTMHFWSKISEKSKNKIIGAIFGVIALSFVIALGLLFL
tara:strand:+ start:170 stop:334 length:165 start_codon:yes stop_codon:yes gene_type:complete